MIIPIETYNTCNFLEEGEGRTALNRILKINKLFNIFLELPIAEVGACGIYCSLKNECVLFLKTILIFYK